MKAIASVIVLLLPLCAAAESCSLEEVNLTPDSARVERLFYTGTCHFRKKEYRQSVELWKELVEMTAVGPTEVELQTGALNNLGYMLFFGFGVDEDKAAAVSYWRKAIGLGQIESEFHLCHAFADPDMSTYDPTSAVAHCEKAKLIYQGIKKKTKDDKVILRQIKKYLAQLGR